MVQKLIQVGNSFVSPFAAQFLPQSDLFQSNRLPKYDLNNLVRTTNDIIAAHSRAPPLVDLPLSTMSPKL